MNREHFPRDPFDVVLVGGGLQNCLVALAFIELRPGARIALLERGPRLGGNHTWSFHSGDVPGRARQLIDSLVVARWDGYDVAFPAHARWLPLPYASISSERLHAVVAKRLASAPGCELRLESRVIDVRADSVVLDGGEVISGKLVVDSRGPEQCETTRGRGGYQKFVGLELALSADSPRTRPLLMDARVPQTDGFRFFYVLPFEARRVLVEDTYFSDTPDLEPLARELDVVEYARAAGMRVAGVLRREQGVLPMPTRVAPAPAGTTPLIGGYAGGWFHPATAYSLPVALRLALHLAEHFPDDVFGEDWERLVSEHGTQARFATWLNRLLFGVFRPETRYGALERFYRSSEALIERFYALRTTRLDRLHLLCGKPPRGLSLPSPLTRRMAS
ncbi:MAG TPA: lycopene beta-cyclase CrtY [Polyangiaceae bacterium]|jgi:lycopene beta-cyclase|nr:lycopene beta-cyclase CrtY [Polyangiaceae bacterium]